MKNSTKVKTMRRLLAFIVIALFVFGGLSHAATVVCTNLIDSLGVKAGVTNVTFTPVSRVPQQYGNQTVLPKPVFSACDSNTAFSANILAGGVYSVSFQPINTFVTPILGVVPSNDTNKYTLNEIIAFATNKNTFIWTNPIATYLKAGTNIVFTTNGAYLVINSTATGGGGGQNQTPWISPINAAGYSLTNLDTLDFALTNSTWKEGRVFYDSATHTLCYYKDRTNVVANITEEGHIRVSNNTGVTITNGSAVTFIAQGNSSVPRITLAQATTNLSSHGFDCIGLATEDIHNGEEGLVTVWGTVHGVNTDNWPQNTTLYLSTNAGAYTTNMPPNQYCQVVIGAVARAGGSNGDIFVMPQQATHVDTVSGFTNAVNALIASANSSLMATGTIANALYANAAGSASVASNADAVPWSGVSGKPDVVTNGQANVSFGGITNTADAYYNSSGVRHIGNYSLYDADGRNTVDWRYERLRRTNNTISVDWQNSILYYGGNAAVNWANRTLNDTNENPVVSWNSGVLVGSGSGLTNVTASALASGVTITNATLSGNTYATTNFYVTNGTVTANGFVLYSGGTLATNLAQQTLNISGTNVTVNLAGTAGASTLSYVVNATTNIYFQNITNATAGQQFTIEIQQAGQFTVGFSTNAAANSAAWIPPAFGQFLTLPTNSTACRQIVSVQIGASGTNAYMNQINFVR